MPIYIWVLFFVSLTFKAFLFSLLAFSSDCFTLFLLKFNRYNIFRLICWDVTLSLFWSPLFIQTNKKGNRKLLDVQKVMKSKNWWKQRSNINNCNFKVQINLIKMTFLWLRFRKSWYCHLQFLVHYSS